MTQPKYQDAIWMPNDAIDNVGPIRRVLGRLRTWESVNDDNWQLVLEAGDPIDFPLIPGSELNVVGRVHTELETGVTKQKPVSSKHFAQQQRKPESEQIKVR